ncbi:MAG: fused MFS/spermidine synthase [Gammaproteobacteria bacterium]|nr:fused MFS/spermidine synthase [Gammaproteobacteria bacterium]
MNKKLPALSVYFASIVSGFVIMGVELIAGRILAPYFGGGIYVWGSIITVFMLALSIGYLLGGKWSLSEPSLKKLSLLYAAGAILLLPLPFLGQPLMEALFVRIEDPRYGSLLTSFILFFPSTIVLGMIAPYAVRLLTVSTQETGMTAGKLYFVSTLGSALGTIMTSFYLVMVFTLPALFGGFIGILLVFAAVLYFMPAIDNQETTS